MVNTENAVINLYLMLWHILHVTEEEQDVYNNRTQVKVNLIFVLK
jgi:hypothetical protein